MEKSLLNHICFTLIDEFVLCRYLQGQGCTTGPRISRKHRVEDKFGVSHVELTDEVPLPWVTILLKSVFYLLLVKIARAAAKLREDLLAHWFAEGPSVSLTHSNDQRPVMTQTSVRETCLVWVCPNNFHLSEDANRLNFAQILPVFRLTFQARPSLLQIEKRISIDLPINMCYHWHDQYSRNRTKAGISKMLPDPALDTDSHMPGLMIMALMHSVHLAQW